MWLYLFSFILLIYIKAFSEDIIELSPVEIPIEVINKKIEKREDLKPPKILQHFEIKTDIDLKNRIPLIIEPFENLPLLTVEKPKSYLGIPPSNALMSKIIDEFNSGDFLFAKNNLQEFIKKYKDSPLIYYAYYLLGYIDYKNQHLESSAENFQKSCQILPLKENCLSYAIVNILLKKYEVAKPILDQFTSDSVDATFLNELIEILEKKKLSLKTDCDKLDISLTDYCKYLKKWTNFFSGNYQESLKIKLSAGPWKPQEDILNGFSYLFLKEKEKSLKTFEMYLEKISVSDKLSNLAYYGKALSDNSQLVSIAGVLQTRDEELSQQLYIIAAVKSMENKDFLSSFLYLQSALSIYQNYKEDILKNIAVSMYNLGNYQYAEGILKKISQTSKEPTIFLYLGYTYYNLKDYKNAERFFQRLIEDKKYEEIALEYLADIYLKLKDYENFIDVAVKLRDINENKAYNLLGWYFFEKEDYLNAFRSFRDSYMKAVSAFNMTDIKTARELIQNLKDDKATLLKAYIYLRERDFEKARETLKLIKDKDTKISEEASYLYAFTYFSEGKFDIAAVEFKNFVNKYSHKDDILVRKAKLRIADSYYNISEIELARNLYSEFISKYSNTEDAVNAAYSLLQLETKEGLTDTKTALENFIKTYPDYPLINLLKIQLASIYSQQGEYSKAEELYQEIISTNTKESEIAMYQLAKMLYRKGDLEKSKNVSLDFIKKYPNSENIINIKILLAEIYEKQSDLDSAISIYSDITDNDDIKIRLAQLYMKKKDYQKAKEYLTQLYRKYPENRFISLQLGKVYYYLSEFEEAIQYLQEATKSENPSESAEGYYYLGLIFKGRDINKSLNNFLNSVYINPQLDQINAYSRIEAADILIQAQKRKEASCLLKEVLKYNDDQIKQKVEEMMKDLPKCVY